MSSSSKAKTPLEVYNQRLERGVLRPDKRQIGAMQKLDELYQCLKHNPQVLEPSNESTNLKHFRKAPSSSGGGGGFFSSWFGGGAKKKEATTDVKPVDNDEIAPAKDMPCKGLYLYGGVGCGKTMLMDMFYQTVQTKSKERRHFHSFMLDIHRRLHVLRTTKGGIEDPIPLVANEITNENILICLDEFQVTDVADAMILRRLFSSIFRNGGIVVATSNRPPRDLYLNGINRQSFLPFIDVLEAYCNVHSMDQGQDHRLLGTLSHGIYHSPNNEKTAKELDHIFESLTDRSDETTHPAPTTIKVANQGRVVKVPMASKHVARFTFDDLCNNNLGAADYIALADRFSYIIIADIPILDSSERNKIRRFITMLDVFYEQAVRVIFGAEAEIEKLFSGEESTGDEQFASGRAISRLKEMQSKEYFARASAKRDGTDSKEAITQMEKDLA